MYDIMKMNNYIKVTMLALMTMVACTKSDIIDNSQPNIEYGLIQELSITGKDFQLEDSSRSSVSVGDSGVTFAWDEDDVIGIFPNKGDQVSFAMEAGAGTQTATFSGGGWALKSSATYSAYFPHVYANRDMTAIPVSYVGQMQNGNANTDHIGAYDFMAAALSTPANGAVAFDMQHLGCLIQLTITVPEPSVLKRVVLESEDNFTLAGTIDLSSAVPAISATSQSKSFTIFLNDIATDEPNEVVTIYFMMPPVDLSSKSLKVIVEKDNYYYQEIALDGKNFEAGKAYKLSANMVSEEESPTVINVATAGTFEDTIYDEYQSNCYKLTSLKVTGNLNGSDIRFLRKLAGRKEEGTATSGKLTYLDLTEANIVSGGDYYYMPKTGTKYYTENNVAGDYMFYFCNLETIKFPSTITKLGNSVCSHLPQPDGNENVEDGHIGTFTSIIIPEGVTTIGRYAFAWNQNLASIEIPNTVKNVGDGYPAFYRCDALTSLNIPDSVESCPNFTACFGLKYLRLPENPKFTFIGAAFIGCKLLTSLTIPANVKTISMNAFGTDADPSALTEIHFKATTPPSLHADSFLPWRCKIYVPEGCYNAYKSANTFKDYTIIEE